MTKTISDFLRRVYTPYLSLKFIYKYQLWEGDCIIENWVPIVFSHLYEEIFSSSSSS